MSERKVHVLPDDNLGGVLREFVEVEREAKDGDFAVFKTEHKGITPGKPYEINVTKPHGGMIEFYDENGEEHWWDIPSEEFTIVEPTNIVHIDGQRYRVVERRAEVGEKVLIVNALITRDEYDNGDVFEVEKVIDTGIYNKSVATIGNANGLIIDREYRVLEPIADEKSAHSTADMLASLAQKIVALERKIDRLEERTESNARDIETWAQEVERLAGNQSVTLTFDSATIAKIIAKVVAEWR